MSKHSTLKVSEHHLMSSLIKLFDCHLSRLIEGSELKGQSEHELNPLFEGIYFDSDYISHDVYDSRTVPKLQVLIISTSRNVLLLLYLVHWSCVRQRNKEEVQLDLHWIAERGAFRGCSKVPSARSSGCSSIGNTLCFPTSKRMWCLFIQGKSFWLM